MIEPGPETLELRGRRCRAHKYFDGQVELQYEGRCLPFTVFEEQRRVSQGAIAATKRLGAPLATIQADQCRRDEEAAPESSGSKSEEATGSNGSGKCGHPDHINPTSLICGVPDISISG